MDRSTCRKTGRGLRASLGLVASLAPLLSSSCVALRAGFLTTEAPADQRLNVPPFLISTNFPLRVNDSVVRELAALREQVQRTLRLPLSGRQIEIFIFDDRPSYERFLAANYPELPPRRAFFIARGEREVVYTFRGERLDEDLRHEACHAIVHAAIGSLPLWLDEGLAEYFETPGLGDGLHPRHLAESTAALRQGWRPGLTRLESLTEVRQMTARDYREAWAWVYFLLHGMPEGRDMLLSYLADYAECPASGPLSTRVFRALPRADRAMTEYLLQLDGTIRER